MSQARKVVVWGGGGFVGSYLLPLLVAKGLEPIVAGRGKRIPGYTWVKADITNAEDVKRVQAGAWGVVNLVGILAERGGRFEDVQYFAAQQMAEIAAQVGVVRLVHVSAAGVNKQSLSGYSRSKALAEEALGEAFPAVEIIRPGLIVGKGSGFARQLELLTRFSPVMPLMGGGKTIFKPVYVETVVALIVEKLMATGKAGGVTECEGPEDVSFEQLARDQLADMGRRRIMVPVPWWAAQGLAILLETLDKLTAYKLVPWWALVTRDQLILLRERS